MKRLKFSGDLIFGVTDSTPCWHIAENPVAGGEFTVCGVAFEELEHINEILNIETKYKNTGICTCSACIEQIFGWHSVLSKCKSGKL